MVMAELEKIPQEKRSRHRVRADETTVGAKSLSDKWRWVARKAGVPDTVEEHGQPRRRHHGTIGGDRRQHGGRPQASRSQRQPDHGFAFTAAAT